MRKFIKLSIISIFLLLLINPLISINSVGSSVWGVNEGVTYEYYCDAFTDEVDFLVDGEWYFSHAGEVTAPLAEGMLWSWTVETLQDESLTGTFKSSDGFSDSFITYPEDALGIMLWGFPPITPFISIDTNWTEVADFWGFEAGDGGYTTLSNTRFNIVFAGMGINYHLEIDIISGILIEFYFSVDEMFFMGMGASVAIGDDPPVDPAPDVLTFHLSLNDISDPDSTAEEDETEELVDNLYDLGTTEIIEGIPLWMVILAFIVGASGTFVYLKQKNQNLKLARHRKRPKFIIKILKKF